MGDLPLFGAALGSYGSHRHEDGLAHEDYCVQARGPRPPDLRKTTQPYHTGSAQMIYHDLGYRHHDDRCLQGSGCAGLGLAPGSGEQGEDPSAAMGLGDFDFLVPLNFDSVFDSGIESRMPAGDPTSLVNLSEAGPVSPPSQASPSPQDQLEFMSDEGAESDGDTIVSCNDSQCPGSEGACSAGTCGKTSTLDQWDLESEAFSVQELMSLSQMRRLHVGTRIVRSPASHPTWPTALLSCTASAPRETSSRKASPVRCTVLASPKQERKIRPSLYSRTNRDRYAAIIHRLGYDVSLGSFKSISEAPLRVLISPAERTTA